MPSLLRCLAFLLLCNPCSAVHISNGQARRDVDGKLMDVHDGNIVQWEEGGDYFWYGMGYRDCALRRGLLPPQDCPGIYESVSKEPCGFRLDHAINLYTSPNLVDWTFRGDVFPVQWEEDGQVIRRPEGIYFRPKVIFNAKTRLYVLWVNRLPASAANHTLPLLAYPDAVYLVATSASPTGPFTVVTQRAATHYHGAGDFGILVTGSEAFLAYTTWQSDHRVSVEPLNPTFTDTTGKNTGLLSAPWNEAPLLMEYEGWYYLLYGETCCFCRQGGGAHVLVSMHPMGPWVDTGMDIAKVPGQAARSLSRSQQSFAFKANTNKGPVWIWAGDQWGTSPDGLKSHDMQYWVPMEWDNSVQPPALQRLRLVDGFYLDLARTWNVFGW